MSGSKDGTVRIWTRNSGVWDQVVCSARTRVVTDRDPKEQIDVLFSQVLQNDIFIFYSSNMNKERVTTSSITTVNLTSPPSGVTTRTEC